MKKPVRKLAVSRETIRALADVELTRPVAGRAVPLADTYAEMCPLTHAVPKLNI
jgi:hypothetical protein